jgi:hypothetical protein
MNCQDIEQNIYGYCDDSLSPDIQSTMAKHINKCASCQNNYQLTLLENEALRDTVDIPLLSEAFTTRVMGSIVAADSIKSIPQPLVMSKGSSLNFKRTTWYTRLAIVAAVITLCLYIPDFNESGIYVADNSFKQPQLELQSNPINNKDAKTQALNEDNLKMRAVGPPLNTGSIDTSQVSPNTFNSQPKSVPVNNDVNLAPSVLSGPFSPELMQRSTNPEAGRSIRTEIQINDTSSLSFSPQNVPTRFQLTQLENNAEKEAIYNYVSQDGTENFQLKVALYREKMTAIMTTSNITIKDSPPSLTRDIQVGEHIITLTISGNIPTEGLTQLVNTIELKDDTINSIN